MEIRRLCERQGEIGIFFSASEWRKIFCKICQYLCRTYIELLHENFTSFTDIALLTLFSTLFHQK